MPSNIVLRNLTNPPRKATNPLVSTRPERRMGQRDSEDDDGGETPPVVIAPGAAPVISAVIDNGATLTIQGAGFGVKAQAAPRYWEMGSDMRIDGEQIAPVAVGSQAPDPNLWGSYNTSNPDYGVQMSDANPRHPGVDQHWRGFRKASLIDPLFFDDLTNGEGHQFYFAYWICNKAYFGRTWVCQSTLNAVGTFNTGEDFSGELCDLYDGDTLIESGKHRLHEVSANGAVTISYPGNAANKTSAIHGKTLKGQITGAEITVAPDTYAVSSASTKHMRFFQKPHRGARTFSGSYSNVNGGSVTTSIYNAEGAAVDDVPLEYNHGMVGSYVNEWVLFEVIGDLRDKTAMWRETRINGKRGKLTAFSTDVDLLPGSVVPASIGLDTPGTGSMSIMDIGFCCDFGEMYFDFSTKRVVITDAPSIDDSTQIELQRPLSWADNQITVAKYDGAITGARYVHVLCGLDYSNGAIV